MELDDAHLVVLVRRVLPRLVLRRISVVGFGVWNWDSGFRIQGQWFRVQGSGCRVQGLGFWVWGSGFGFGGLGFGSWGVGSGFWGLVFRVQGLGFRIWVDLNQVRPVCTCWAGRGHMTFAGNDPR